MKYVGFCDILGFSSAVLNDFDATLARYQRLKDHFQEWPLPKGAQVSLYSDSILIVGDELPAVLNAINIIQWSALLEDWLVRGGVAYGRYWEESDSGNLFVVSDALIKAVEIEKSIKIPAVGISKEITLGIEAWVPRLEGGIFNSPLLHFQDLTIVNPFGKYWFRSATVRVSQLLEIHPEHQEKYNWFLSLADAISKDELLVPESALTQMLELGILRDLTEIQPD